MPVPMGPSTGLMGQPYYGMPQAMPYGTPQGMPYGMYPGLVQMAGYQPAYPYGYGYQQPAMMPPGYGAMPNSGMMQPASMPWYWNGSR